MEKGDLIVYPPHSTQHYSYYSSCPIVAYWIHFTGTSAEQLLRENFLLEQPFFHLKDEPIFPEITMKIVRELQLRSINYPELTCAYFQELIYHISRTLYKQQTPQTAQYDVFIPVIDSMHNNYNQNITIEQYAKLCDMSTYYFIRKFKEYTGLPPHAYLTEIRIKRACTMLLSTNLSVSEITYSIGYDNPLYFSRIFKKNIGESPVHFRNFHKNT